jgi:hypothetical protein
MVRRGTLPCTPLISFTWSRSKGASLGPLFYLRFIAMVSTGLAGAHVQPVLEYFLEPGPGEPAASAVARADGEGRAAPLRSPQRNGPVAQLARAHP